MVQPGNDSRGVEDASNTNAELAATVTQERELLCRKKTRAMGFLRLSLTELVKPDILNTSDPTIARDILANVYSTQTIADVMKTLYKWDNLKMTEDMSVSMFEQHV